MRFLQRASRVNPWKISTFLLIAGLASVIGTERMPSAEAAGPARLSKALSALRASKKYLDEAKEPPAPFHAQSIAVVGQAISAVEREIKAYEAAKAKGDKGEPSAKSASKKKDSGKDRDAPVAKKRAPPADPSDG